MRTIFTQNDNYSYSKREIFLLKMKTFPSQDHFKWKYMSMFLSVRWQKNTVLNSTCLPKKTISKHQMLSNVFCCCHNLKREETAWPLLFLNCDNRKNFGWHLAFDSWFLVVGWCNEKNTVCEFAYFCQSPKGHKIVIIVSAWLRTQIWVKWVSQFHRKIGP